jgi:hypothetical protein
MLGVTLLLAGLTGRVRLIQKLVEGDPIAWAILSGVVVIGIGGIAIKARQSRSSLDR